MEELGGLQFGALSNLGLAAKRHPKWHGGGTEAEGGRPSKRNRIARGPITPLSDGRPGTSWDLGRTRCGANAARHAQRGRSVIKDCAGPPTKRFLDASTGSDDGGSAGQLERGGSPVVRIGRPFSRCVSKHYAGLAARPPSTKRSLGSTLGLHAKRLDGMPTKN